MASKALASSGEAFLDPLIRNFVTSDLPLALDREDTFKASHFSDADLSSIPLWLDHLRQQY